MTQTPLSLLRPCLSALGVDGMVVPRADEHLGEYVPLAAERLAWLTGFTGSAGLAIVLGAEAAVFTDGRYVLQLAAQTDGASFQLLHLVEQPPHEWAATRARRLAYDPWLVGEDLVERYTEAGLVMVPVTPNPIDALWQGRPPPPCAPAKPHPLEFAGQPAAVKLAGVAAVLRDAGQDCCVLSDPASINWLLNIRGDDLPFVPVALAFATVQRNGGVDLFIDPAKLSAELHDWLGPSVTCRDPAGFGAALDALAGTVVRVDRTSAPAAIAQRLRAAGATVSSGADPCVLPRACKNAVEQEGARKAQRRDGVAVCQFLQWLEQAPDATEMSAAAALLGFREEQPHFRGESFPAISGAGAHGAVIHYRVTPQTDRPIGRDQVYLIDSGGQYDDGTTDITRTVWTGPGLPPAMLRERFTRVLQGNIALAGTVFPSGVAGPHLDAVARRPLWAAGLDYDHGTGHGVGSYLSVHEGPAGLSRTAKMVPLAAGMILSDEPGFYAPGEYGIRLETLLLVRPMEAAGGSKPFLRFEVLTLAPFDRRLIDAALLSEPERAWLDAYHARVAAELTPLCDERLAGWLTQACAPIHVGS